MFVKICGLRSAEDVAAALDAGADAVGFVFHAKSVRNSSPEAAAAAAAAVPGHVKRVAVMRHPSQAEWQAVVDRFEPDVLQSDVQDFVGLDVPDGIECWPVFREGGTVTDFSLLTISAANQFVYEGANSGTGQTVNWQRAAELTERGNMILAGGLDASNVGEAVATVQPFGVDVSSGVESTPGIKDAGLITEFVTAAKAAGRNL